MQAIEFHQLSKQFGKRRKRTQAVHSLDLHIAQGEVFGFLGPNGAGKSTSIKLLLNFLHPTSGTVIVLGKRVGQEEFRERIGYLSELPIFYDHQSGAETLAYSAQLSGVKRSEYRLRISELLERMNLVHAAHKRIGSYSKGMKQRLGMANALVHDPELLILDEPMSGLDPVGRHQMKELIKDLRQQGKTIFFSSHILSDIESLCDRIGIINKGQLLYTGDVPQLCAQRSAITLEEAFVDLVREDDHARCA